MKEKVPTKNINLEHVIQIMNRIENCDNMKDEKGVMKWFAYLQGYIKGIQNK